jgi:hypothetical protein
MDAYLRNYFESVATNAKKVMAMNDPKLTQAVLINMKATIDGAIYCADLDVHELTHTPTRDNPRKRKALKK